MPADPDADVELTALPRDHAHRLSRDDTVELAELVGLGVDDVVGDAYAAGCGLSWLYLRVRPDAVGRSRPGSRQVSETSVDLSFLQDPFDGIDVYAAEPAGGAGGSISIRSRVYVPGFGIPEDPATGSAAAGLGLVLVASGLAAGEGTSAYAIEQGVEMGRPSRLTGRVEAADGRATLVHVAGRVIPIASGTISVP